MQNESKPTWDQTKSKIKAHFGKLTDENIESTKGNLDLLSPKLQSAYGYAREQADKELTSFRATLKLVEPVAMKEPTVPQAVPAATPAADAVKKLA